MNDPSSVRQCYNQKWNLSYIARWEETWYYCFHPHKAVILHHPIRAFEEVLSQYSICTDQVVWILFQFLQDFTMCNCTKSCKVIQCCLITTTFVQIWPMLWSCYFHQSQQFSKNSLPCFWICRYKPLTFTNKITAKGRANCANCVLWWDTKESHLLANTSLLQNTYTALLTCVDSSQDKWLDRGCFIQSYVQK